MGSFRHVPHAWIPLADGVRLSARLWIPEDAASAPVGAVLEYLPYRKDDRTARQDSTRHPYFAERGIAAVRVDLRGTGDSEGVLLGEYLASEIDDALEVIAWIAEQPWCNGAVGMIGYSWGGFNGLQVAARRPPALKAVVTIDSTDDRYTDDCHYLGGAMLGADMLRWAQTMRAIDALPPDPALVGDAWRTQWRERLPLTPHFAVDWLAHQRRDDFWRQGSVAEDYSSIEAATLVVGGWADAYTNAVPRLVERLSCPRAGLIGPWAHMFPERGVPGPRIGFLQECVAWFDRWLNGAENDSTTWPLLQAWIQEPFPPGDDGLASRPGSWVAFDEWPTGAVEPVEFSLASAGRLLLGANTLDTAAAPVMVRTPQTLGAAGGCWCANGLEHELPEDQRDDDALSVCFETEPMPERREFLGRPVLELDVAADRPVAHLVARLCDVAPDGTSVLVSYGVLNLTHRADHADPEPLVPGARYRVGIELNVLGQAIEPGHRMRLALSTTWWPMVWPTAEEATVTVWPATARLMLPELVGQGVGPRAFGPPEEAEPLATVGPTVLARSRRVGVEGDALVIEELVEHESTLAEWRTHMREEDRGSWRIVDGDPGSAVMRFERDYLLERDDWRARVLASGEMRADAENCILTERLEVFDGDERIHALEREYEIGRDLT